MKKSFRALMLFVCTFAVAPAVFADEVRSNSELTKNGRSDCEILRKQVAGTAKAGSRTQSGQSSGVSVR